MFLPLVSFDCRLDHHTSHSPHLRRHQNIVPPQLHCQDHPCHDTHVFGDVCEDYDFDVENDENAFESLRRQSLRVQETEYGME